MSKRILIVEPSRTVRLLLSTSFKNAFHQVVTCTTPQEALQFLDTLETLPVPDMIFLTIDYKKDAYSVIHYALSHTRYTNCRIVALVIEEEKQSIQKSLKDIPLTLHYLVKPVRLQDALALLSVPVGREEHV